MKNKQIQQIYIRNLLIVSVDGLTLFMFDTFYIGHSFLYE